MAGSDVDFFYKINYKSASAQILSHVPISYFSLKTLEIKIVLGRAIIVHHSVHMRKNDQKSP